MGLTPQQKWNAANSEKRKQSDRQQRQKYKQIAVKLDKQRDRHLIEWVALAGSNQDYLYKLIEQDYLAHRDD